ncbi:MAG: GMP synthase (glutamine-hydrolyzing), partial [Clostridiales bacterium]|nr:GMP synthase (glutamine-hydrolyzing) [Clostridiales bacterium]
MDQTILIIDFGSQFTQLIARRVRQAGVFSQVLPYDISLERIKEIAPSGIILSGGPAALKEESA